MRILPTLILAFALGSPVAASADVLMAGEQPAPVEFGKDGTALFRALTAPGMKNEGRKAAPPKHANYVPSILYTPSDEATSDLITRDGAGYYVVAEQAMMGSMWGLSQEMAYDGDDVYFKNPIFQFTMSNAYIKGIKRPDRMSFTLPQALYKQNNGGYEDYYYCTVMYFDKIAQWYKPYPDDEMPDFDLMLGEDGAYEFDCQGYTAIENHASGTVSEFPNRIIGLVDATGEWYGYGDYYYRLYPHTDTLVEAPAGLETTEYVMTFNGAGQYIQVGFDGDDVYISGFSARNPGSWVKGTLKDGKITIPSLQYMGITNYMGYYTYFFGLDVKYETNEAGHTVQKVKNLDEAVIAYDETTREMKAETDICICGGRPGRAYLEYIPMAEMRPHEGTGSLIPAKPIVIDFLNMIDERGGQVLFDIPYLSVNNDILDAGRMHWRLFIDDEPFVLDAVDYLRLSEDLEWVPFFYNDGWDIMWAGGIRHHLYFYVEVPEKIGVQSRYTDEYGDEYFSEPVSVDISLFERKEDPQEGVDGVKAADVTSTTYYDLVGRRVENPGKGIYVKVYSLSDGTVKSEKVTH